MKLEEEIVQQFPYRCPYCDQPVSYDQFDLKIGDNEIQCPSCKRTYIKVVSDFSHAPHAPRRVRGSPSLTRGGKKIANHFPVKGKRNRN
jgi:DNA-directed RNA polymerase subunit RPC12/RpoP